MNNALIAAAQTYITAITGVSELTDGHSFIVQMRNAKKEPDDTVRFVYDPKKHSLQHLVAKLNAALKVRPEKFHNAIGVQMTWDFDGHKRVAIYERYYGVSEITVMQF